MLANTVLILLHQIAKWLCRRTLCQTIYSVLFISAVAYPGSLLADNIYIYEKPTLFPQGRNTDSIPNTQNAYHDVGKIRASISNFAYFCYKSAYTNIDGCEYPINSELEYLRGCGIWIGGITSQDTLTSVGFEDWTHEFWPDSGASGEIIQESIQWANPYFSKDAISEQDFISRYTDLVTDVEWTREDPFDNRPHIPLGIEVIQKSYAWGVGYAEDFIFINFNIANIGVHDIEKMFIGLNIWGMTWHPSRGNWYDGDEITGFLRVPIDSIPSCRLEDSLYIVWCADNDGKPNENGQFDFASRVAVAGIQLVDFP